MANIKPFAAYRPALGLESKIAALPYDVYNRKEAFEVVQKNPDSFLSIDRAETSFPDDVDTYDSKVYEMAASKLKDWILQGKFIKEHKECYYLYELVFKGRSQTGIVGCASIDDYQNQIIKKHENTRADKEIDRIRHVDSCNMQTGPIFLAYRKNQSLEAIIKKVKKSVSPVYDFTSDDGIIHRVWVIDETKTILEMERIFEAMKTLYIADGHHRCASAVKVGLKRRQEHSDYDGTEEFNYFLSVMFQDDELKIMDYNRVVKDLNGYDREEFISKIQNSFEVSCLGETCYKPEQKGTFGMYLEGKWYRLKAKQDILSIDPVEGLDVSILQNKLLNPILGIRDPKTDKRIDFVGGIRGLKELERRVNEDMKVAFSLYPTSMEELENVADKGLLMPPKSTWFEPKLRSGLFLHEI